MLDKIGRYEIRSRLGRGAMATVYRAYDPSFAREVALKIIVPEVAQDSEFRSRFEREAKTIAALDGVAIVPVYDLGEENGYLYLVMRLMEGGTLRQYIKQKGLSLAEATRIIQQIAPTLDEAHAQGIIHRDLKPDNILLDHRQNPYLADFGLAKAVEGKNASLTQFGSLIGTPAYMSPEQIKTSEDLDGRSDIYSLGITLFEMLTGQPPYTAEDPITVAYKHINEPVPVILARNRELPSACQGIIERAMAKDREARYQTAAALATDLSELAHVSGPVMLSSPSVSSPLPQPFVYGRPVRSHEFLNRENEIRTILNRLHQSESTAVSGEPRIGKTSLLLKLADEATQHGYLVSFIDLYPISKGYNFRAFWEDALEPLEQRLNNTSISKYLGRAKEAGYSSRALKRLMNQLDARNIQLVILMDEFERLLFHPNFQNFAFFATLRSLASSPGFAYVLASRHSLEALSEHIAQLAGSGGSPIFNILIEVQLRPFDEEAVTALFNRAGDNLSPEERHHIHRVTGGYPFLLQALLVSLLEKNGPDRLNRAFETFRERVAYHFDDIWSALDGGGQTAAVILSLAECAGHQSNQAFQFSDTELTAKFQSELQNLARRGLVEQINDHTLDARYPLIWGDRHWIMAAEAFTWWMQELAVSGTRRLPIYDTWLNNKQYTYLLTEAGWKRLVHAIRNPTSESSRGIRAIVNGILNKWRERSSYQ